jgi:endo-1,4-beta-mannosidase
VYPLYTSPAHTVAQMVFLAERYRDEPAIMAWDLRSEGDADYAEDGPSGGFARRTVLTWLAETAALIREHDDRHLITAGWLHDAESTAPYVDFVSFQHWDDAIRLRERIAAIRAQTNGPILLEAFGYSTYLLTPLQQGQRLQEAIQVAEYDGLAGWLIWTAFDFPPDATCQEPDCPDPDGGQNHFGLWGAGYEPKIGLGLVRIALYDPARVP